MTCRVKPQACGVMPVPKPMKLLLMKEHALPSQSTTVKYTVSVPKAGNFSVAGTSTMALQSVTNFMGKFWHMAQLFSLRKFSTRWFAWDKFGWNRDLGLSYSFTHICYPNIDKLIYTFNLCTQRLVENTLNMYLMMSFPLSILHPFEFFGQHSWSCRTNWLHLFFLKILHLAYFQCT